MNERRRWTLATFLFVAGDAVAMQTRGPLLSSFQAAFEVSPGALGLVAPAGTVGFVVAVLAVGAVAGRVDLRRVLLGGTAGTAACLLAIGAAPGYLLLLVGLVGQGTATGVFRGGDRAILSHLYPERRGRVFNLYALAWALGAVAGPLVVTGVLAVADWRATYVVVAALFLPVLWLLAGVSTPASVAGERALSLDALGELLRRPAVLGMGVGMALTGGIEGTVFTWLPYYAASLDGVSRGLANASLSAFLLAYVVGRAGYSAVAERVRYLDLLLVVALAAGPVLYVAFGGLGALPAPALFAAVFAAGLLTSGLFPTLSAFGVDAVPEYSGPVNALGTGATYVGIAVVPAAVGALATPWGIGPAMRLTAALAVALLLVVGATRLAAS